MTSQKQRKPKTVFTPDLVWVARSDAKLYL